MKRKKMLWRTLGIVLTSLVACFALYVAVDCVRLKNAEAGTKPLIVLREEETENRVVYRGIGYAVSYEKEEFVVGCIAEERYCGAEFDLFGRIFIWGWEE